eukprot:RCo000737
MLLHHCSERKKREKDLLRTVLALHLCCVQSGAGEGGSRLCGRLMFRAQSCYFHLCHCFLFAFLSRRGMGGGRCGQKRVDFWVPSPLLSLPNLGDLTLLFQATALQALFGWHVSCKKK